MADLTGSLDEKFLFLTREGFTKSWSANDVSICTVSDDDTERDDDMVWSGWLFLLVNSMESRNFSPDTSAEENVSAEPSLGNFLPNSKLLVSKYLRPNWFWPNKSKI